MTKDYIIESALMQIKQSDGTNEIGDYISTAMDHWAQQREEYWKQRCLAAEEFIEQSPCDPDITSKQIEAHSKWRQLVDNQLIEQQNKEQ